MPNSGILICHSKLNLLLVIPGELRFELYILVISGYWNLAEIARMAGTCAEKNAVNLNHMRNETMQCS